MNKIITFEDFINESFDAKSAKKAVEKFIADNKIDKIDIEEIVYQYRYNGAEMRGKVFSGDKEIESDSDFPGFFDNLAEILKAQIKKGGTGAGDMEAAKLFKILPSVEIRMKGEIVKPEEFLDVETGSDY